MSSRRSLIWATVSESLFSLCRKERHEWFVRDFSKMLSETTIRSKKFIFLYIFDSFSLFFLFFMPKSDLLLSLFTKESLWANRSHCSLQKSDRERVAQVAHDKRATGAICSFSRANRSFAHKNDRFAQKTDERIPNPEKFLFRFRVFRSSGR